MDKICFQDDPAYATKYLWKRAYAGKTSRDNAFKIARYRVYLFVENVLYIWFLGFFDK